MYMITPYHNFDVTTEQPLNTWSIITKYITNHQHIDTISLKPFKLKCTLFLQGYHFTKWVITMYRRQDCLYVINFQSLVGDRTLVNSEYSCLKNHVLESKHVSNDDFKIVYDEIEPIDQREHVQTLLTMACSRYLKVTVEIANLLCAELLENQNTSTLLPSHCWLPVIVRLLSFRKKSTQGPAFFILLHIIKPDTKEWWKSHLSLLPTVCVRKSPRLSKMYQDITHMIDL
jgi:hypothetical protein